MNSTVLWEQEYRLEEIDRIARELLIHLKGRNILISGLMGSGKTTLVSALVRELGSADQVSSPTFGWVNPYLGTDGSIVAFHFDNYRIEDPQRVNQDELWEYYRQGVPILMEWPEKLTFSLWPEDFHVIRLLSLSIDVRLLVLYGLNVPVLNESSLPIND